MSAGTPREKPIQQLPSGVPAPGQGRAGTPLSVARLGAAGWTANGGCPGGPRALLGGANLPSGAEKSRVRAATRGALCIFYSFLTDSLALLLGISLRFPDK